MQMFQLISRDSTGRESCGLQCKGQGCRGGGEEAGKIGCGQAEKSSECPGREFRLFSSTDCFYFTEA